MRVYLGADHAGFELKEKIKDFLAVKNIDVQDLGAFSFDQNDDYPDIISKVAEKISKDNSSSAIIFGKSGTGEAIVANKFKDVRAFVGFAGENVRLAKEHNNANILSLGSEFVTLEKAKQLVDIFLQTPFSDDERHVRRLNKIKDIEQKNYA